MKRTNSKSNGKTRGPATNARKMVGSCARGRQKRTPVFFLSIENKNSAGKITVMVFAPLGRPAFRPLLVCGPLLP
jgi:hypothetical protein